MLAPRVPLKSIAFVPLNKIPICLLPEPGIGIISIIVKWEKYSWNIYIPLAVKLIVAVSLLRLKNVELILFEVFFMNETSRPLLSFKILKTVPELLRSNLAQNDITVND